MAGFDNRRSIRPLDRMKSRGDYPVIENPVTRSRSTTPENKKMGPTKGISRPHTLYSQIFATAHPVPGRPVRSEVLPGTVPEVRPGLPEQLWPYPPKPRAKHCSVLRYICRYH